MTRMVYQGRKWDAPLTDDAIEGRVTGRCAYCQEVIEPDDNATATIYLTAHLECQLRSILGDVQHLERRCMCFRGSGNEEVHDSDAYPSYRDSAKAALQWLLDHHQGRFHHD